MRLYKVKGTGPGMCRSYWTGRKDDVATLKRRIRAEAHPVTTQVDVETVDFEQTKDGILGMLNKHAARS
jgi:hypothetical protein